MLSEHESHEAALAALDELRAHGDVDPLGILDPTGQVVGFHKDSPPQTFERLPDFELSPLTRFEPEVISKDDDVDSFVLALAFAYNDVKDSMWFLAQMTRGRPATESEISPYAGQIRGMRVSGTRRLLGILHEILEAIKEADEKGVLNSPRFRKALARVPPLVRKQWKLLADIASARAGTGAESLRSFLVKARNNLAFHYYQPKHLLKGYRSHFVDLAKSATTSHAYVSLGPTMESTRFYFADAAAQRAMTLYDPDDELQQDAYRHLDTVGYVISRVVVEYLRLKQSELNRRTRPARRIRRGK